MRFKLPRVATRNTGISVALEPAVKSEQASPEPPGWSKSRPNAEIFLAPFSSASPTQPQ